MGLRFVIGRAGTGKSTLCLEEIRKRLEESPDGHPLLLLVPEQSTFQVEQALLESPEIKGYTRAQVFSFRRLAWRVMQETGHTAGVPIDDLGKAMLLQRVIHKRRKEWKVFQQAEGEMGLIGEMTRFFKELKRCGITPEAWEAHTSELPADREGTGWKDKLEDLSLLYREYESELAGLYLDTESFLPRLAAAMQDCSLLGDAELWVDGFFGFTPQELEVIVKCALHCRQVTVTLCLDRPYEAGERPDELDLFHPTARAMIRLKEQLDAHGAEPASTEILDGTAPPRFAGSPMLAHLERQYALKNPSRGGIYPDGPGETGKPSVSVHAAVHRRAEVEGAAREMLRLVRDEGLRWRDLSVRVRKLGDYSELIGTVFPEYGIPYFLDEKRSVVHHPLVEFIRSSLEIIQHNWRYEAVFRCVKTDFLLPLEGEEDAGSVDRNGMDELENYVLARGIQGYRWKDDRNWSFLQPEVPEEDDGITPEPGRTKEQADRLTACRERIVPVFQRFEERFKNAGGRVSAMTEALYALLEECRVPEKLEGWSGEALKSGRPEKAREHGQVWDRVMDLMDQLVELLGEETVTAEGFTALVDTGLEAICLGLVPPSMDEVLVGTMDRTRSTQKKYSFVLGVNEGVLPAKADETPVLSDAEREKLRESGLDMPDSLRRRLLDEQLLVYSVLCSPSEHLWVSYPLADEEGKSLLPSEIIKSIRRWFPGLGEGLLLAEPDPESGEEEQMAYLSRREKALAVLHSQMKQGAAGRPVSELWWEAYNWFAGREAWKAPLERLAASLTYQNREKPLAPETSRLLYGNVLRASVSRMERYVSCPFSQFASHGLKLRERRIYRLQAPDIGQLFHAALSHVVRDMQQDQLEWAALRPEEVVGKASAIVDKLTPRLQSEILLSTSRNRYIARKLKETVGQATLMLARHHQLSEFVPVGLELGFGPGEPLPALAFRLPNGCRMEIVGRIDRVDRAEHGSEILLRVLDYKSSETNLRLTDLFNGLSLQMLTYLDVVITHSPQWLGQKARPAGVLYFHVHNPLIQTSNGLPAHSVEAELRKRFKMKGLVADDTEIVRLMDRELKDRTGYSQVIPVSVKTDGSFSKVSSVASPRQWDLLRGYVRSVIREIGTEITNGQVGIVPYQQGPKSACTFCSYRPVCHFDAQLEGNQYRLFGARSGEEIWEAMEQTASALEGPETLEIHADRTKETGTTPAEREEKGGPWR